MRSSALSARVFSVYLFLTGAGLVLAPAIMLGLFGIAPPVEPWVRVLGVVVLALAAYYLACAGDRVFMRATVPVRVAVALGFALLVAFAGAPWQLLLFGAVDATGALWTAYAMRHEAGPGVLGRVGRGFARR
jgi:hypothetical protein